ncbi:MAG: ATP-binding protein [Opitutus sp.]
MVSTSHIVGALLAVIAAVLAFWQVRELRARKKIRNLENTLDKTSHELRAANSANEEFLSNISHDLRNPMGGILGLSKALDETPLTPAQQKLTESIRSCTGLLSTLIDDLLDLSKLRAGQIELAPTRFHLGTCIEDVVTISSGSDAARAAISTDVGEGLPRFVFADRARLQQILLIFLSNAHKFGAGKPVELSVDSRPEGRVRFSVQDQGCGLSPAETALVFQRFATLQSDRTLRGKGLGLATSRVLAERMGGCTGVESTVGAGSCFWVELPLLAPLTIDPSSGADSPPQYASALVVEDIDYSAAASEAILRSLGFRTESVSDGPSALSRLETSKYDLVLLDWNIPGLVGTKVAARFRARERSDHPTIIIATTAYSADRNRDACLAAGMNAFIAKPLTPEKISRELRRLGLTIRLREKPPIRETSPGVRGSDLDLQILQFLSDGTAEGLNVQIARYQSSFEADITSAHLISRGDDGGKIALIAHRLISHAAAIKCAPIVELAEKLQRHAHVLSPPERKQLLCAIEREFAVLKGKLGAIPISTRPD